MRPTRLVTAAAFVSLALAFGGCAGPGPDAGRDTPPETGPLTDGKADGANCSPLEFATTYKRYPVAQLPANARDAVAWMHTGGEVDRTDFDTEDGISIFDVENCYSVTAYVSTLPPALIRAKYDTIREGIYELMAHDPCQPPSATNATALGLPAGVYAKRDKMTSARGLVDGLYPDDIFSWDARIYYVAADGTVRGTTFQTWTLVDVVETSGDPQFPERWAPHEPGTARMIVDRAHHAFTVQSQDGAISGKVELAQRELRVARHDTPSLLFTEYIQWGSWSILEISNRSTRAVEPSSCELRIGSRTRALADLEDPIAPGESVVLCGGIGEDESFDSLCSNEYDVVPVTGTEVIQLRCGGKLVDSIGTTKHPGPWDDQRTTTQGVALFRSCFIQGPDTNTGDDFQTSVEWSTEAVFLGGDGELTLYDLGLDCALHDPNEGPDDDGEGDTSSSTNTSTNTNTSTSGGATTDLFISEYLEGTGNNKALEIANFTGHAIDLASYSLSKIANGGAWGEETFALSGTLANGKVLVLCHPQSSAAILAACGVQTTAANWNGNDAVGLAKKGTLIDAIGTATPDGVEWSVAGVNAATRDHVLRRVKTVRGPTTNWVQGAQSEWTVGPQDDASDLGKHTFAP